MRTSGLLICLCGLAFSQTAPPQFEAADVHVSSAGTAESGGFLPSGRAEFEGTSLLRLISRAYGLPVERVAGGPPWLDTDRFDIRAKAASPASAATMRMMLSGLLAERFGLVIKDEQTPVPVYVLLPGKGGSAKRASGAGEGSECRIQTEEGFRVLTCTKTTIAELAEQLPGMAGGYFDHPVVDRSGVEGAFDFQLRFLGRGQLSPGAEGRANSLYNVIEKQFGVKVEPQTVPLPGITVVSVNRQPTPNPSGVTEKLGNREDQFEVAQLKRSRPDEKMKFEIVNGRINAEGIPLKVMIQFAYNVQNDELLKGGEKWLDSDTYDLVAKTEPTDSISAMRPLMQSLLAERFALKVHREEQPVTVYALTVGQPKLKKADPAGRSGCRAGAADGAITLTCQNTTMAQLTERLPEVATSYIDHPVVDLTGLSGVYDFEIRWTPKNRVQQGRAATAGDNAPAASDPSGLTLYEAVDRQLGLKLATRKHALPVLVIDHIDRTAAEN